MNPRDVTERDLEYFESLHPQSVIYDADPESVEACAAIVTDDESGVGDRAVRIPWVLDELELVHLAQGGTLWVTTLGGLPPHYLHVQPPHVRTLTDLDGAGG